MAKERLTPYQVLGVGEGASVEAIKRAFRSRSKECHPDVCPDPSAAEKFRALKEATDELVAAGGAWRGTAGDDLEAMVRRSRDSVFW